MYNKKAELNMFLTNLEIQKSLQDAQSAAKRSEHRKVTQYPMTFHSNRRLMKSN